MLRNTLSFLYLCLVPALIGYGQTTRQLAERTGLAEATIQNIQQAKGLSLSQLDQLSESEIQEASLELFIRRPQELRRRFRLDQLANQNGSTDTTQLVEEFERAKRGRNAIARGKVAGIPVGGRRPRTGDLENSEWDWLGPGNIGGRTRTLAFKPGEPDTIFAGTAGGGIWKTTNAGGHWEPVNDFLPNLAVTHIVFHPTNPLVAFAATGEGYGNIDALRGAGLFRSVDGGDTWASLTETRNDNNFQFVNRLAISSDGTSILAATKTGIMRNQWDGTGVPGDGTWTKTFSISNGIGDVDFKPNSAIAIAGSIKGGKILRSTNSGASWSVVSDTGQGRVETCFATANSNFVYASVDRMFTKFINGQEVKEGGMILRSTNGGISFAEKTSPEFRGYLSRQGWYDNAIWAGDDSDPDLVVVAGVDVFRSFNGGQSLQRVSAWWIGDSIHADHHVMVAAPNYDSSANQRTVFFGNDGGVYKAQDVLTVGNNTNHTNGWVSLNNNFGASQLYGIAAGPDAVYGGLQDNGHLVLGNGMGSDQWSETFGGDGGFCATDPVDGNFSYGEYVYLAIHRSSNGGVSAELINGLKNDFRTLKPAPFSIQDADPLNPRANFIAPFELDPNEPNRMLAGGHSLWRSNDIKAPITATTGPRWKAIKPSIGTPISAIGIAKGNSNRVFVGHNNGSVFKSTNGTATNVNWQPSGTGQLPLRYCHCLKINPHDHEQIWATFGGFGGNNVWVSEDGGTNWNNRSNGLPKIPVRAVEVHPKNEDWIYVGTELGVYASEDAGASWSATNEGPANVSVDDMTWKGTTFFLGTHGRGAYSIDLNDEQDGSVLATQAIPKR